MFWKIFDRAVDSAAALCLLAMSVIITIQVFYRYVLNDPLLWPLEGSLLIFVYLVWLAGASGMRDGNEIRIELAETYLPQSVTRVLQPILTCISISIITIVIFLGIKVVKFQSTNVYDSFPFSRGVLFAVAPIVGSIMFVYLVRRLIRQIGALTSGASSQDEEGKD